MSDSERDKGPMYPVVGSKISGNPSNEFQSKGLDRRHVITFKRKTKITWRKCIRTVLSFDGGYPNSLKSRDRESRNAHVESLIKRM